jgi:glycosyltransferase involved in cell wall biosynthesis
MLVTVYIPTKNRLHLLRRALTSVLEQDYSDIEIIVVDDGSSDGSVDYLRELVRQGRIRAIFYPRSQGACQARNAAIEAARGECVTGLDDDDYFEPGRIASFVAIWKEQRGNRNLAGLFDSVRALTSRGEFVFNTRPSVSHLDLRNCNAVGSQVFAPVAHYRCAGLFDPLMPAWQDWDLWLRMTRAYGDLLNINRTSYVIDELSACDRISSGREARLRQAHEYLTAKIGKLGVRERANLIVVLHMYPQVEPRISEIIQLLIALRLRASLRATRRWMRKRGSWLCCRNSRE